MRAAQVNGSASADAKRSRTLPEGITLAERERLYDETVHALLYDYNASQEQAIRQYLQPLSALRRTQYNPHRCPSEMGSPNRICLLRDAVLNCGGLI